MGKLLPCLALLATPIAAQIADTASLEARVWRMENARIVDFPEPAPHPEAGTRRPGAARAAVAAVYRRAVAGRLGHLL